MLRFLLTFVMIPLALVGCGKTTEQQSQDKANDGNAKIARMNAINTTVASTYGVVLIAKDYYSTSEIRSMNSAAISQLSSSQLQSLQPLVAELHALASDVINIMNSGDVTTYGSTSTFTRAMTTSEDVLSLISVAAQKAS